jgi:hypothetical protein
MVRALGGRTKHYVGTTKDGVLTPGSGSADPGQMWLIVGAIGVASTLLMLAYDRFVAPRAPPPAGEG